MTSRRTKSSVLYAADQMFDLVADVERYPDFLPWCVALRVVSRRRSGSLELLTADMVVAYNVFRERFTSKVTLDRPNLRIDVDYVDGPFRTLKNSWVFTDDSQGGSTVDFYIEFEFRNLILHAAAHAVLEKAFVKMSDAFVQRARAIYAGS